MKQLFDSPRSVRMPVAAAAVVIWGLSAAAVPAQRPTPTPDELPVIISRADDMPATGSLPAEPAPDAGGQKTGDTAGRIRELGRRISTLESTKENEYDRKQRRLLLNLDILTRAEQRAEVLRGQLFNMIEREAEIATRLENLDNDLRPEMIDRTIALTGSLRPEELRAARRKYLESEKGNLENLLTEVRNTKTNLEENVRKADALVDRLREKLEKEIDDALSDDERP